MEKVSTHLFPKETWIIYKAKYEEAVVLLKGSEERMVELDKSYKAALDDLAKLKTPGT